MRILLSNKFYYPKGGDCIYTMELEKLLIKNGHEVAIFTQQHPKNKKSKYSRYWPSGIDYSQVSFSNIKEQICRPIKSNQVADNFARLIRDFKPEIVHLNNIHSQISPIIAQIAYENNIPIIWTLHDYKLLCPSYSLLRNDAICELCMVHKYNVIKYRCVKNIIGSTIAYIEAKKWNRTVIEKYISKFIAPSNFLKGKMVQGGFISNNIIVQNNFISDNKIIKKPISKDKYYLYFGRFSNEKGLSILLNAASQLPYHLKLVGDGPLFNELRAIYNPCSNIEFIGFKKWDDLKIIIQKAQFSVIPSICYENNPFSIIESYALGTPVIGANIGGIPELIIEKETGYTFQSGSVEDLKVYINKFYIDHEQNNLGANTIKFANNCFKSSFYYNKILTIYEETISQKI